MFSSSVFIHILLMCTIVSDVLTLYVPKENNATLTMGRYQENRNASSEKCNDNLFTWPTPRQIAKLARMKLEKMLTDDAWDPLDSASNTRYKSVIDALPVSIRKAILNQTRADEIEKSDLILLDPVTIAMLQKELSRTLTDKQLTAIIESMLDKQLYRQAAQVLERMGDRFASMPDTITLLIKDYSFSQEKRCTSDMQAFIRQALRLLTPPEKWNWTVVRKFGPGMLAALPLDLIIKIRDSQASGLVLDEWLSTATDFFGCASVTSPATESRFWIDYVTNRKRVQVKLLYANLGEDVRKWSPAAVNRYGSLLPYLTPRVLELIDGRIVIESPSALSSLKDLNDSQGYALVQNLAITNSTGLVGYDSTALGFAMARLGSLGIHLLPEFVNASDVVRLSFLPIWAEKLERLADAFEHFPRWTASALLQYRLLGIENYGSLPSLHSVLGTALDANFVKVISWKYFKLLLHQPEASSIFTKNLLIRLAQSTTSGNLLAGQVRRLSPLAIQRFRRGRYWDISSTPWIYWGGTSINDWSLLSGREIRPVLDRIHLAAQYMKPWQLALVYKKLKEEDYDLGDLKNAQVVKAMTPAQHLKVLGNMVNLKRMAADMPPDSITRLLYASIKFREGLSVGDLGRERFLASNIDSSYVASVPLYQIPILMDILVSLPHGPSAQTMHTLHDRLKEYTRMRRVDVADSDVSLLENTWLANYNIYPGYALAGFSFDAVQAMLPTKKFEILRSVGRLSLIDYYSIPRKTRLNLLENGLAAMGKLSEGWLNEEDLTVLGITLVDLPSEAIDRLVPRAFEYTLPLFQGEVEVYEGVSARPCLTIPQRSAIRKSLKRVPPSTWNYGVVKIACCSLDTLADAELDAIRDDLILMSCRGCAADNEPLLHLQHLRQRIEERKVFSSIISHTACRYELGLNDLQYGLLTGKERVVKRRARAAFNTYRDGRVRTLGINDYLFNKDQTVGVTCDMVIASGSGAGFSNDQISTLSNEDIQDCLFELGYAQLTLEQATAILNRTLQVYGNAMLIPKDQVAALGWVLRALNESMIESLNLESENTIAELGSGNWQLNRKQMEALASKAAVQYNKDVFEYTGFDLMVFGRILCGMNASFIDKVPTVSYVQASVYLGVILGPPGWCSPDALHALSRKAVQTAAFGPSSKWNAAVVRNVGAVIGGLSPEDLRAIPSSALQGLTPTSVQSIDPNNFQAFKRQQLLNFPLAAAQAVMMDKRYQLIYEMKTALNYVIYANMDSGSPNVRKQEHLVVVLSLTILLIGIGNLNIQY